MYRKLVDWKTGVVRKPLLLRGARQVGKTWLLTDFGKKEFALLHTINFEKEAGAHSLFDGDFEPNTLVRSMGREVRKSLGPVDFWRISCDLFLFTRVKERWMSRERWTLWMQATV